MIVCLWSFPSFSRPLRSWRTLRLRTGVTYKRPRLWITFLRRFWGVFLGDFWEASGPGARVRGDFSADGVLLARWASGFLPFFAPFLRVLGRFLPVFRPNFALFPSMPCTYLYVHNFRRTRVSRFGRENLAFDKETAAATRPLDPTRAALSKVEGRNALSGRGLTAKPCFNRGDRRERRERRNWGAGRGWPIADCGRPGDQGLRIALREPQGPEHGRRADLKAGGGRQSGVRDLRSQSRRAGTQDRLRDAGGFCVCGSALRHRSGRPEPFDHALREPQGPEHGRRAHGPEPVEGHGRGAAFRFQACPPNSSNSSPENSERF